MDIEDIGRLHDDAVRCARPSYTDPSTGYTVFTAETLRARGRCCGCGCRHCPYNHENVPLEQRASRISSPALLAGSLDGLSADGVDVLLWSGGKDSFLAARALVRERGPKALLLLTTFDARSRQVAHQEVSIDQVVRQARAVDVPLLGVPLWPHIPYSTRLEEALRFVAASTVVKRVCTGDLRLADIRQWREDNVAPLAAKLHAPMHYPLWNVPYDSLLRELFGSAVPCTISALDKTKVRATRL